MPITNTAPPARKPAAPPSQTKAAVAAQRLSANREEAINGLGQIAQVVLVSTKQYADAGAVGMYFPGIASEVAKLADADARIARFVDPLLSVGPYTGLVAAVLPFVMQIMVNHGRGQAGVMGTVSPDFLEAKMKTAVAQSAVQAKKEQAAMEAELKRMNTELTDAA